LGERANVRGAANGNGRGPLHDNFNVCCAEQRADDVSVPGVTGGLGNDREDRRAQIAHPAAAAHQSCGIADGLDDLFAGRASGAIFAPQGARSEMPDRRSSNARRKVRCCSSPARFVPEATVLRRASG
jgi:hypothetical protein